MPFVVEIARGASVMWAHCEQTVVCEGADPGNERQALKLLSPPVLDAFRILWDDRGKDRNSNAVGCVHLGGVLGRHHPTVGRHICDVVVGSPAGW